MLRGIHSLLKVWHEFIIRKICRQRKIQRPMRGLIHSIKVHRQ